MAFWNLFLSKRKAVEERTIQRLRTDSNRMQALGEIATNFPDWKKTPFYDRVVATLIQLLESENHSDRNDAARHAEMLCERRTVPALVAALKKQKSKLFIISALARIRDFAAVEPLLEQLNKSNQNALESDWNLVQAILFAFARFGDPREIGICVELLKNPEHNSWASWVLRGLLMRHPHRFKDEELEILVATEHVTAKFGGHWTPGVEIKQIDCSELKRLAANELKFRRGDSAGLKREERYKDFEALKAYWKIQVTFWWTERKYDSKTRVGCHCCNEGTPQEQGYLHGEFFFCEQCCSDFLSPECAKRLQFNEDYFGPAVLKNAYELLRHGKERIPALEKQQQEIPKVAIAPAQTMETSNITHSDLDAVASWWRHRAKEWWLTQNTDFGTCDYCNKSIAKGTGYLHGSYLICDKCCDETLDNKAINALQENPNYFGQDVLRKAREFRDS